MYGYNELGEAARLLEMARSARGLLREARADGGDPERLHLLAGLHALRLSACYCDTAWTQRPVDLLANVQLPDDGEEAEITDCLPEGADEARTAALRRAYARLLCLETLDCLMQFLRRMDDRLKWLETAEADQLPVRLHAALAVGWAELEHMLAETERRRGERMRLDVFDQQISYPERIARAAGTHLGQQVCVRIPGQCIENFGAHPELLLLLAVMYRRLKAQGVTRAQLQAGEDFWEIPGGAKGLGVYAPGITPDTFQARVIRVLDLLGANAPVQIVKFNDVYMARIRPDVFEWFEKANENAAEEAAEALSAAAEFPRSQGDTEEARLLDAWRLYLDAKHARAQAQGEAQRTEHDGHIDIVLTDDGAYEAFAELENICRARTQARRPARRGEKQREGMFRLFMPDAEPTAQLWVETQAQRLAMAADAVRGWQALKAQKSFGKPLGLMNNYSAGWEDRVKKLLLGYLCACSAEDGFAAECDELPAAAAAALAGAGSLEKFCAYRARLSREELRLVIRKAGARTLFSLGTEERPETGGLESWIFRESEFAFAPVNAKSDMRKWLTGGVIRFLQEDAEVVNRQKNKALDLKKRKQAAYNQTKALHLALSHWLTLRQKGDIEGCVVTLDSAGGIRLCDGRLAGGMLHAVENGCVSTMEDMLESMFAGEETGINAFLNRIVRNAEYKLVMRRQKKTETESEYRAFLCGKGGGEERNL